MCSIGVGPVGFLRVLDGRTVAFADFAGNKQYISAGNLETNDRVAIFLMDYVHRARLKIIGHGRIVELGRGGWAGGSGGGGGLPGGDGTGDGGSGDGF